MAHNIIARRDLMNFVDAIIKTGAECYGVQAKEQDAALGKYHFAPLAEAADLRLDYDVTVTPPKMFFTPPKEYILKFRLSPETSVLPVFASERRVVIGVHPYDMTAINQMDKVFRDRFEDAHYFKRRNSTMIIGCDPEKVSEWGFWCHMGAAEPDRGYDLWLTKLDNERYFLEVKTAAGKDIVAKYAKVSDASEKDAAERDRARKALHKTCGANRVLRARPDEIPRLVKENWNHPIWEEKAKKCYSCGSCNLVCPTCYCFDVTDELSLDLKDGTRERRWDGCQLEDFAAVGSGENFRKRRVDRFKHRFYRKTLYIYEKFGQLACVGCGRCGSACLPDIADPLDIINALKGEDRHA
jgi:ferredoxin